MNSTLQRTLWFTLFTLMATLMLAQSSLRGTLIDAETRNPLAGANVAVLGSKQGAITDAQGQFSVQLPASADSLRITYFGYTSQTLAIPSGQAPLNLSLRPDILTVEQVVVTASREKQSRSEVPIAITTISPREIEETKATSLDQLLNRVPSVNMIDLGNEQHAMSIRQPIATNGIFLYLEDGIPLRPTGAFNHNALIEINQASLQRVEVVRGPVSSMYGSEAVGGAINFINGAPTLNPYAQVSVQGNTIGFRRVDLTASNTYGKLGVYANGYYAGRRNGFMENSDYDKVAFTGKVNYALSSRSQLSAGATYLKYRTDATVGTDSLDFFNRRFPSQYEFGGRDVYALRAHAQLEHSWTRQQKTTATVFFRDNYVDQNATHTIQNDPNDLLRGKSEISRLAFTSYGAILRHKAEFDFLNSQVLGGLSFDYSPTEIRRNFIDVTRNEMGDYIAFENPDSLLGLSEVGLYNYGGYLQYSLEPVKNLRLSLGARYDQIVYDYDNFLDSTAFSGAPDSRNTFQNLTPKVGLTYQFTPRAGVYANYSQGFLPPQVGDLYRGVKVPTLQHAEFSNYEAGGWFALSRFASVEVNVYRLDGVDEIINVDLPDGTREKRNAGNTRHLGVEYTLILKPIPQLDLHFAGSNARHEYLDYVESGEDFTGNLMPYAPRWQANARATYRPDFLPGFRAGVEWIHVGEYFVDQANSDTYAGYDLFHVRLGYRFKGFELWANVMNLTDELYSVQTRKRSSGWQYRVGELRSFNLGISYTLGG